MTVGNTIRLLRLREWLAFDSVVIASLLRSALALAGLLLYGLGSRKLSFRLLSAVHRAGSPALVCRLVQRVVARALRISAGQPAAGFNGYFCRHIATSPQRAPAELANDPERMLKNLAIVVASAESGAGRGVIIINYNYAFPLFAQQYDLRRDRSALPHRAGTKLVWLLHGGRSWLYRVMPQCRVRARL